MDWDYGGPAEETTDPLLMFTAWSRLRLLDVRSCSLFDEQTKFKAPLVKQVLVNWVPASTTNSQVYCFIETSDMDEFMGLSADEYAFDHLVNLKVMLDIELSACQVNSVLDELLHCCQSLQVLSVSGELKGAVKVVVDAEHGSSLTDLRLESLRCNLLDLRQTSNLTSVESIHLDPCREGRKKFALSLPSVLQSLRVVGGGMF